MIKKGNIFEKNFQNESGDEIFENIYADKKIKIERIISTGQITPENEWLSDKQPEWVILLQGNAIIMLESKEEVLLDKGDYLFIPAGVKHRVEYTSSEPESIWLAFHFE